MIKTIGIITDDDPRTDPSILVFNSLSEEHNCKISVIDPTQNYNEDQFKNIDVLYPRISGTKKSIVESKLNFYEQAVNDTDLPLIGNPEVMKKLKDKYNQVTFAEEVGLTVPKTVLIRDENLLSEYLSGFSFPVVIKSTYSFGGNDVFLANSEQDLRSKMVEGEHYLIQEFIKLDNIIDYRVYVAGDKVVGGIIRENKKEGEFRANTTQGGSAEFYMPDLALAELALKYAKATKSEILAVDFIKKTDQYTFIEMNDAFSVKVDNEPKKIIVAKEILNYLIKKAVN